MKPHCLAIVTGIFMISILNAEEVIYDEAKVPAYTLPDPLVFEDGRKVENADQWQERRQELLGLFADHVYGKTPYGPIPGSTATPVKAPTPLYGGKATMQEIDLKFGAEEDAPSLRLLVVKPTSLPAKGAPAVVGLNFRGNHTVDPSPEITLCESWVTQSKAEIESGFVKDNRATEKARGSRTNRWPVEKIIDAGVILATFYYGDVDPDFHDEFENGIHRTLGKPKSGEWGSIGAWAWAASRVRDYLEQDKDVNQSAVAVFGHSRLGKTALWAGAQDERFALVISNNSGCGGAALSRRCYGERVARINTSFPHWFTDKFKEYNEKESEIPVDQHQLVALIAPRMVYVASAVEDRWADPLGEFLAAKEAEPVYSLLGKAGLGVDEQPGLDQAVGSTIRYHIRTGKHDVVDYDWEQYLNALNSLK